MVWQLWLCIEDFTCLQRSGCKRSHWCDRKGPLLWSYAHVSKCFWTKVSSGFNFNCKLKQGIWLAFGVLLQFRGMSASRCYDRHGVYEHTKYWASYCITSLLFCSGLVRGVHGTFSERMSLYRLARQCAQKWAESREKLGYPLGVWEEAPCPETIQQASTQVYLTFSHLIHSVFNYCLN